MSFDRQSITLQATSSLAMTFMFACAACGSPPSHLQESRIPGYIPQAPRLGQAYDKVSDTVLSFSCVTSEVYSAGNTVGNLEYLRDLSMDEIMKRFSGGFNVGLPAWLGFSAGFNYAREAGATQLSDTHTVNLNATPKSIYLDQDSIRKSGLGESLIEDRPSLHASCGDEFVSQVDLGASLFATLKVEFANEIDKEEFNLKAGLTIGVEDASVNLGGELGDLSDSVISKTKISINAIQLGGLPEELFSIMPATSVVCNLREVAPCLTLFENVMAYARDQFKVQLKDPNNYNMIRIHTQAYRDSHPEVWDLRVLERTEENDLEFEDKMRQLTQFYTSQKEAKAWATFMLEEVQELPVAKIAQLQSLVAETEVNLRILDAALRNCRKDFLHSCDPDSVSLRELPAIPELMPSPESSGKIASLNFLNPTDEWTFLGPTRWSSKPEPVDKLLKAGAPLTKAALAFGASRPGWWCLRSLPQQELNTSFELEKSGTFVIRLDAFAEKCRSCKEGPYLEINGEHIGNLSNEGSEPLTGTLPLPAGRIQVRIVNPLHDLCGDTQFVYLRSLQVDNFDQL